MDFSGVFFKFCSCGGLEFFAVKCWCFRKLQTPQKLPVEWWKCGIIQVHNIPSSIPTFKTSPCQVYGTLCQLSTNLAKFILRLLKILNFGSNSAEILLFKWIWINIELSFKRVIFFFFIGSFMQSRSSLVLVQSDLSWGSISEKQSLVQLWLWM